MVSKNVKYSTTQRTNLAVGCYRVKEPDRNSERILIIRDEDKAGDPVVVTELDRDRDSRQINVSMGPKSADTTAVASSASSSKQTADSGKSKQTADAGKSKQSPTKKVKYPKPKARIRNEDSDEVIDEDDYDSDDDDDDPSWGSSRKSKKKNDMRGKKKKRSKH